jgi:hypothetical protein
MTKFLLRHACARRLHSLELGLIVLSICCLSSSAFSQQPQFQAALPDAHSAEASASATTSNNDHSLTLGDRTSLYVRSIFSPDAILGPAFGAGIGQAQNSPKEWGQGGEGYGKRFASGVARREISETIRFGFAAADGEDPRYFPLREGGMWARTQHAVVSTFVSKTSDGRAIPAFSRFAGNYGAALISNTWYPTSRSTTGWALERGSTALASSVGFNLLREFVPFWFGGAR